MFASSTTGEWHDKCDSYTTPSKTTLRIRKAVSDMSANQKTPAKLHPSIVIVMKDGCRTLYIDRFNGQSVGGRMPAEYISRKRWADDMGKAPKPRRAPRNSELLEAL